jgi:hypothetical protein
MIFHGQSGTPARMGKKDRYRASGLSVKRWRCYQFAAISTMVLAAAGLVPGKQTLQ